MNSFHYYNPVRISFGSGTLQSLPDFIGARKLCFITTPGFIKRGIMDRLKPLADRIVHVVDGIPANPTFSSLQRIYADVWKKEFDVIVAIGGGSVMDGAKVLSVYNETRSFDLVDGIIRGTREKKGYKLIPIIAIPTTAGTGSELTPWATVWDMDEKKKYSLHLPDLWAERCIADPILTLSLPRDITIQTSLDALSQALEAIWNKNANPISTAYAIASAKEILRTLPSLVNDLDNLDLRTRQMWASINTAMAFSNTQTAVAHAISYYITAHKGTPHGIACSFTLPDIIDAVKGDCDFVDDALRKIFGEVSGDSLRAFMKDLGVGVSVKDYGLDNADLKAIRSSLEGNIRAGNSLVDLNKLFKRIQSA